MSSLRAPDPAKIALGVTVATSLAQDEVTDFVIFSRHVKKGVSYAATFLPRADHPFDGFYFGATRDSGLIYDVKPDFDEIGRVVTPEQVFDRHDRLVARLGGRKRMKGVLDPVKEDSAISFLAVTSRGEEILEASLVLPYFGPLAAKWFVKSEHLDNPIDVVWRPDFGVSLDEALDAVRDATLAAPKPKKKIREAHGYHPLARGSVLARLHGIPTEWARSFLDGQTVLAGAPEPVS